MASHERRLRVPCGGGSGLSSSADLFCSLGSASGVSLSDETPTAVESAKCVKSLLCPRRPPTGAVLTATGPPRHFRPALAAAVTDPCGHCSTFSRANPLPTIMAQCGAAPARAVTVARGAAAAPCSTPAGLARPGTAGNGVSAAAEMTDGAQSAGHPASSRTAAPRNAGTRTRGRPGGPRGRLGGAVTRRTAERTQDGRTDGQAGGRHRQ